VAGPKVPQYATSALDLFDLEVLLHLVGGPRAKPCGEDLPGLAGGVERCERLIDLILECGFALANAEAPGFDEDRLVDDDHGRGGLRLSAQLHEDQFGCTESVDLVLRHGEKCRGRILERHGFRGRNDAPHTLLGRRSLESADLFAGELVEGRDAVFASWKLNGSAVPSVPQISVPRALMSASWSA
jgi:hypothetical protein